MLKLNNFEIFDLIEFEATIFRIPIFAQKRHLVPGSLQIAKIADYSSHHRTRLKLVQ